MSKIIKELLESNYVVYFTIDNRKWVRIPRADYDQALALLKAEELLTIKEVIKLLKEGLDYKGDYWYDKIVRKINQAIDLLKTEQLSQASQIAMEPFTLYHPKIFPDGDQWCVLLGDSIQEGVTGFGDTPRKAAVAFNHNFNNQTLEMTK